MPFKRDPRQLFSPLHRVSTQREGSLYKPGNILSPDTESASALILDFPASRTMRNERLLLTHQAGISRVLASLWREQPKWTKTTREINVQFLAHREHWIPIITAVHLYVMGRLTFSPRFPDWTLALYISWQALAIRDIPANNHSTRRNTARAGQRDTIPGLPPLPSSWRQSPGCSTAQLTLCVETFCGR